MTTLPAPARPTFPARPPFPWGTRTVVMGIVNVTPDSFSGDGLVEPPAADTADVVAAAVEQARRMVAEGADILDVGGESTRPGHARVDEADELARVLPVIRAIHAALPATTLSVDTTRPAIAAAALEAGATMLNDIWGVRPDRDDRLDRLAARHGAWLVLMHNRAEARYEDVVAEVVADLRRALDRAVGAGVREEAILVDPGFGFGKTPEHNLAVLRHLDALRVLGRPVLLGTSRKSTLGRVLDVPVEERVEATLATTALGVGRGADAVRVHDVLANVRTARMADAIVRGWADPGPGR